VNGDEISVIKYKVQHPQSHGTKNCAEEVDRM